MVGEDATIENDLIEVARKLREARVLNLVEWVLMSELQPHEASRVMARINQMMESLA